MPDATVLPQARFARAGKKARRAPRREELPAVEARQERIPPLAKLLLACAAVVAAYAWVRLAAPRRTSTRPEPSRSTATRITG